MSHVKVSVFTVVNIVVLFAICIYNFKQYYIVLQLVTDEPRLPSAPVLYKSRVSTPSSSLETFKTPAVPSSGSTINSDGSRKSVMRRGMAEFKKHIVETSTPIKKVILCSYFILLINCTFIVVGFMFNLFYLCPKGGNDDKSCSILPSSEELEPSECHTEQHEISYIIKRW